MAQLTKKEEIIIEMSEIESAMNDELKDYAKNTQVPGYRKGKAPVSLMKKRFGEEIKQDLVQRTFRQKLQELVKDKDLMFEPDVGNSDKSTDDQIIVDISYKIFPEIPTVKWEEVKIESYEVSVDKDNEETLEQIKSNFELLTFRGSAPEGHKIETGDTALINAVGRIDSVEFDGGKVENHELTIGSAAFIPGFEEQLIGASKDETVIVVTTFPEEYHASDLSGKEVEFEVNILDVLIDKKASENQDEYFELKNIKDFEAYKEGEITQIQTTAADNIKNLERDELFKYINDNIEFEVDDEMFANEVDFIKKQIEEASEGNKNSELSEDEISQLARRRVKTSVYMLHYQKHHDITVTEMDIFTAMNTHPLLQSMDTRTLISIFTERDGHEQERQIVNNIVREEKTIQTILEQVQKEKSNISVDGLKQKLDEIDI